MTHFHPVGRRLGLQPFLHRQSDGWGGQGARVSRNHLHLPTTHHTRRCWQLQALLPLALRTLNEPPKGLLSPMKFLHTLAAPRCAGWRTNGAGSFAVRGVRPDGGVSCRRGSGVSDLPNWPQSLPVWVASHTSRPSPRPRPALAPPPPRPRQPVTEAAQGCARRSPRPRSHRATSPPWRRLPPRAASRSVNPRTFPNTANRRGRHVWRSII